MVNKRRGQSTLGCLFTMLILVAVSYFAFNVAEPWVRYLRFRDAIEQEAKFAKQRTDDQIRKRLAEVAAALELPPEAHRVRIRRSATRITISAGYEEHIELPLFVKTWTFAPVISGGL